MMKLRYLVASALLTLALAGCKKEEPTEAQPTEKTESAPKEAVEATPASLDTTADEVDEDGIPTEEDFEEEAASTITPENLEDELDKIEQEISEE